MRRLRQARDDDRGASLVEYALLVALIAVVSIAAVTTLGDAASDEFAGVGSSIGGGGDDTPPNNCPPNGRDNRFFTAVPGDLGGDDVVTWAGPGWYEAANWEGVNSSWIEWSRCS